MMTAAWLLWAYPTPQAGLSDSTAEYAAQTPELGTVLNTSTSRTNHFCFPKIILIIQIIKKNLTQSESCLTHYRNIFFPLKSIFIYVDAITNSRPLPT